MKKAIITIIVGLFLVGCSNQEISTIQDVTITNKLTEKKVAVIQDSKETTKKRKEINENKDTKKSKDTKKRKDIKKSHENKIYWYEGKENSIDHDYKIELEELLKSQNYSDDDYRTLNENHYNTWDNELNVIYNKLLKVLDKEEKELLIKSQKGWLQLHINEPEFINRTFKNRKSGSIFGSLYLMQVKNRQLDWIRRRTLQLIDYYNYLDYSYDFEYKSKYPDFPKMEEKVSGERKKQEIYVNFDTSGSYKQISYSNPISKDYKVELEKLLNTPNYSNTKVLELQHEFNDIWDKELNIVYNKLLNKLEKEEKELLKKAQTGWVQHHMNEGKFFARTISRRLGSLGRFENMDEDMERLKRRTLELMEYCYYLGEDFDFSYESKKQTAMKEVTVSNVDELIQAIEPNTHIKLRPGVYNVSNLNEYTRSSDKINYYAYREGNLREGINYSNVSDGAELQIYKVDNLIIEGMGDEYVEFICDPRGANVIVFIECDNITLKNLKMGHTIRKNKSAHACDQGVVLVWDSQNFNIHNSLLYGCGTIGLETRSVNNLNFDNSIIEECTQGIMSIGDSTNIKFISSKFRNCQDGDMISIYNSQNIKFNNCEISDNAASKPYFAVMALENNKDIKFVDSEFNRNYTECFLDGDGVEFVDTTLDGELLKIEGKVENNKEEKDSYRIFDKGYHDYKGQTSDGTKFIITLYPKDESLVGSFLKEKSREDVKITGKKQGEEVKLYYKDHSGNNIEFFSGTMKTVDDIYGEIHLSKALGFNEDKNEEVKLSLLSIVYSEYNNRYGLMGAENDDDIEKYAAEIQEYVINGEKEKLAKLIKFPIDVHINSESKTRINSVEEFIKEYDNIMNPEFKAVIENAFTRCMFSNYSGAMFGEGVKSIWFAYLTKDGSRELKIVGISN